MWNNIIYGPVKSRRLGVSLGINILPHDGKICSFDCAYCECGYNANTRTKTAPPKADIITSELDRYLQTLQKSHTNLDSITFSGNGEPTLHPEFKRIIQNVCVLRDKWYPKTNITVLSNGTMVQNESVFAGLQMVNNAVLKLDSAFDTTINLIDKPIKKYSVQKQIELFKRFNGNFILQTIFLRGTIDGILVDNTTEKEVFAWLKIVQELMPKSVMVYTLDRPTPCKTIEKIDIGTLKKIAHQVEKFNIPIIVSA